VTSFWHYYLGTICRPRRTFEALLGDPRRLRFGLCALAINALLYTLEAILNSPTIWRAILLTLYSLSVIWFVVLFTLAVATAQRIGKGAAALVGSVAHVVYQGFFVIFNR
jgi:hypothetical protein